MKMMTLWGRTALVAGAAALPFASPALATDASVEKKDAAGSHYVQCDGQPNNVTSGETAARLLGAITLLALFAPTPEAPDASKRKFGADGVAACNALLEGDKREGNAARRIGLMMARALHHIEAKEYDAAIADADRAEKEAVAAGLMADPYFQRSRGRGFDMIRAAALFRQGKAAEARDVAVRTAPLVKHSLFALSTNIYSPFVETGTPAEANSYKWLSHASAFAAPPEVARLEELGRFKEAATIDAGLIDYLAIVNELQSSTLLARAAVADALAGNYDVAKRRAAEAQANFDKRKADGKPESSAAEFVELIDLYHIIEMANAGDVKGARRLFSARSQWTAPSFGTVVEVTRRLRNEASADERIGGLARDPAALWKDRKDSAMAAMLAKDSDNKTLFYLLPWATPASAYEAMSKTVWDVAKSKIILNIKPKDGKPRKYDTLFLSGNAGLVVEGYALHAALLAKSRGQQGFVMAPLSTGGYFMAIVLTGNRGDPGLQDALFNDAEQVIADLAPIIPSPEVLKARRAAK